MRVTGSAATTLWLATLSTTSTSAFVPAPTSFAATSRRRNVLHQSLLPSSSVVRLDLAATVLEGLGDEEDVELRDVPLGTTIESSSSSIITVDWDWQSVAHDVFREDPRPVILFDGVCNLCHGGVNFAIDHDHAAHFRFASLHSQTAQSLLIRQGRSPSDWSQIVLVTPDKAYYSSDAVSRICRELDAAPLQWIGQMGQFAPKWVREPLYQFVSAHRHEFGETESCRIDFDGTYTSRFLTDPMPEVDDTQAAATKTISDR